jgi:hypothetical protein
MMLSLYREPERIKSTRRWALVSGCCLLACVLFAWLTNSPPDQPRQADPGSRSAATADPTRPESPAEQHALENIILVAEPNGDGLAKPSGIDKSEAPKFAMPDWPRIFNADGSLKDELDRSGRKKPDGVLDFIDLYDGLSARFTREVLSNGVATDMSALLGNEVLSNQILYNGPVSPAHDLGNTWTMTAHSPEGGLRLFAAVERLTSGRSTFIEFEFNQIPVQLGSGTPWWQLQGERSDDDLLVTMTFSAGKLESVEVAFWADTGFEAIQDLPGIWRSGCVERSFIIYCVGPPQMDPPTGEGFEVWDENFVLLVELALDIYEIYSKHVGFAGFIVRTPQDVALDWFPAGAEQVAGLYGYYRTERGSE